ncbi:AbrB/MazE/SpoVT family DNA-binding domain-containing protein [Bacillus thuringiensis]|uniref:AbrB/MazE/SpoVT family DNA-binding domain-containing protein n=1 Tax=Bacillus thuringiensis TaxID=1428 RepID=UPI002D800060|nr:AbrB/MazE/SpoVT family DNA-binding domain-containing protein [Bacillus thuringiensis]MEB4819765.1 AbrB/MazE/SpoVT family DNA-binding domain-containing protein [Bacillus thuringiensis]
MKNTGVTRKVDELGRVVIPVELRRTLGITEGTTLGFHVVVENIILRKHEKSCFVTGKVADIVKKVIFHDYGFDPAHCPGEAEGNTHKFALELGDILNYISIISHEMGDSLEDIAQINISRLTTRYPERFSQEASQKRADVK